MSRPLGLRSDDVMLAPMRGRARLSSDVSEIKLVFSIRPHRPTPNIAPSWNVAPTDPLPVVSYDAKASERSLDITRWGLVPYWAQDIKVGFANMNAMAETVDTKPAFREAFQRRRCLVPVDNFYEREEDRGRQAAPCDCAGRPAAYGWLPTQCRVQHPARFWRASPISTLQSKRYATSGAARRPGRICCWRSFQVGRESRLIPVTDA